MLTKKSTGWYRAKFCGKCPKILKSSNMYAEAIICHVILTIKSQTESQKSMECMKNQPYASKVKLDKEWPKTNETSPSSL